jgi:hypothetical protein
LSLTKETGRSREQRVFLGCIASNSSPYCIEETLLSRILVELGRKEDMVGKVREMAHWFHILDLS